MKKNLKLILFTLLLIFTMGKVEALVTGKPTSQYNTSFACPGYKAIHLQELVYDVSHNASMYRYKIYTGTWTEDRSQIQQIIGDGFCMDPNKQQGSGSNYTCKYIKFDPNMENNGRTIPEAYILAYIIAYQKMLSMGIINDNLSDDNAAIIGAVFRYVEGAYGFLNETGSIDYKPANYYNQSGVAKIREYIKKYGATTTALKRAQKALEIYDYTVNLANKWLNGKVSIASLIKNGKLWMDQWRTNITDTQVDTKNNRVTLDIVVAADGTRKARNISFKDFKFSIDSSKYGYKIVSQEFLQSWPAQAKAKYRVVINTKEGKPKKSENAGLKFGIKINTNYIDEYSPLSKLMMLSKENDTVDNQKYYQNHLLIKNKPSMIKVVTEIPLEPNGDEDESCACETDSNDNYTGNFYYSKYQNGKLVDTQTFPITDSTKASKYSCPSADTCKKPEPEKHTCQTPEESGNGKYYCKESYAGAGDGEECSEQEYNTECKPHTCQTPSQSGDGKYYCKESSPGAGDGEECSEADYNDQCLCPTLKDKCETNPSDPECNEYNQKCVSCNPTMSLPSDCNNFDTQSEYTGVVSDINEVASSCNPKEDQVKKCVLGKNDLTGTSFEATNELNGNPYCKVWCKENYQFTVPTAQYSTSGGYFTLTTKINGTRDCYTSSASNPFAPIDEEKFENDLADAQYSVVSSYNEYSKWNSFGGCELHEEIIQPEQPELSEDATTPSEDLTEEVKKRTYYTCSWKYNVFDYASQTSREETGSFTGETLPNASSSANSAKSSFESGVKKMRDIINKYNDCFGQISTTINDIESYNLASNGWSNNMQFNPTIDFNYDEDYLNQVEGKFEKVGSETTSEEVVYCNGDVDDQYNCTSGAVSGDDVTVPNGAIKSKSYVVCTTGGCKIISANVGSAKWIKKSKTKEANYRPNSRFSTYTQYGTIKLNAPECNGNDCLWTRLPDEALPVALKTGSGVFNFKFTYGQIGQSNSNSTLGRLIGNTTSVLTSFTELANRNPGAVCSLQNNKGDIKASIDGGYVCHYINNCPSCDFSCKGDDCYFDDESCVDGKCTLKCDTCIFDGNNSTFKFRTVSLNNLFPNEREVGYNWNSTDKAVATKKEIEEKGEEAYADPEYSYTITPSQMSKIREYNKAAGSYTNTTVPSFEGLAIGGENSLNCESGTFAGLQMQYRCKSRFLDANGTFFTENKRNQEFTEWTGTINKAMGIGPSWK